MTDSEIDDYIRREGLDVLIDFDRDAGARGPYDAVAGTRTAPIPPSRRDLAFLHRKIRERLSFTVLEFGVGYSTLAIADALAKNQREWASQPFPPAIRNRFLFQVFSVDANAGWIEVAQRRLPEELADRVHLHHSPVEVGTWQDRICHYYTRLPDIVPDFVYLDGPGPKDVTGNLRGLSFACDERTVMSADLLAMEPTLLPGTFIVVDGRTNNARFLARHFERDWSVVWDREADLTTFELVEERLGIHNRLGRDFLPAPPA